MGFNVCNVCFVPYSLSSVVFLPSKILCKGNCYDGNKGMRIYDETERMSFYRNRA